MLAVCHRTSKGHRCFNPQHRCGIGHKMVGIMKNAALNPLIQGTAKKLRFLAPSLRSATPDLKRSPRLETCGGFEGDCSISVEGVTFKYE